MISTVTNLSLKTTNDNSIDNTTGDWLFVPGENELYLVNNKNNKKYKIDISEIS